jgi:hypothetical protein
MIKMTIDIEFPDLAVAKRAERRIARDAGNAAMKWFVQERLPLRFGGELAGQLRFEPRNANYVESQVFYRGKLRKYRVGRGGAHRFTGKAARQAEGGKIFATVRRFGVKITGLNPGYAKRRGGAISLQSEIQRMTPQEIETLATLYTRTLAEGYVREWDRSKTTTTI